MPPTPLAVTADAGNRERRRQARRHVLSAYLSVAFVVIVLIVLAWASLGVGWRAEQAEREAERQLEKSYLAEARGHRLATTLTRRDEALRIVRSAASLRPTAELRNEAVASLALPAFEAESSVPLSSDLRWSALSPDLQTLAEGLADGEIVLRRMTDGGELFRLSPSAAGFPSEQSGVALLTFSDDGKSLVVRHQGGASVVWDLATRKPLLVHDADKARHPAALVQLSDDGRFAVGPIFTPVEGQGVIEVATGRLVASFPEMASWRHTAVRPGTTEFAINTDRGVAVVDWAAHQQVTEFDFPAGCRHIRWSADGKYLGIVGNQLEAQVWNFPGRQRQVFANHNGDINTILFDPEGNRFATSSTDGQTRLWDLRSGSLIGVETGRVLRLDPQGRLGLEKPDEGRIVVRRLGLSPVYRRWHGLAVSGEDLRAMDISPDGTAAATGIAGEALRLWNLANSEAGPIQQPFPKFQSLCFHPADGTLLVGKGDGPVAVDWRGALARKSSFTEAAMPIGSMEKKHRSLLAPSPDGQRLAGVSIESGSLSVVDPGAARELFSVRSRHNTAERTSSSARGSGTMSFSPDGRWLACGYAGEAGVTIYDAASGEPAKCVSKNEGAVQFSPDGRWLIVAHTGLFQLFRTSDWGLAWEKHVPRFAALAAAFSPDGQRVAAPDSATTVGLWETATGRPLCSLEAPDAVPVTVLRWTADGSRLFCGLRDQRIEAWDIGPLEKELTQLGLGWDLALDSEMRPSASDFPFKKIAVGVPIIGGGAALIALLGLGRYRRLVTDIIHSDAIVRQRERDLESARELTHLKDSFVSTVSHEFRTPLAVILSSAELLHHHLDRLSPERRAQQFESIREHTLRMAQLVDDVLLLGKVDGGHMTFAPTSLVLRDFCGTLVDEAHSASRRRNSIAETYAEDLPEEISADPSLLRHVLSNLLSNAAKYSPEGSVITLSVEKSLDGMIAFRVTDHGIGIPEADLPRLFEAFHRAGNVGNIGGTGLGLVITKRCVEIHGGTVSVVSEVGKGTTFTVTIPFVPPPSTP